jgi:hypothetical protein
MPQKGKVKPVEPVEDEIGEESGPAPAPLTGPTMPPADPEVKASGDVAADGDIATVDASFLNRLEATEWFAGMMARFEKKYRFGSDPERVRQADLMLRALKESYRRFAADKAFGSRGPVRLRDFVESVRAELAKDFEAEEEDLAELETANLDDLALLEDVVAGETP